MDNNLTNPNILKDLEELAHESWASPLVQAAVAGMEIKQLQAIADEAKSLKESLKSTPDSQGVAVILDDLKSLQKAIPSGITDSVGARSAIAADIAVAQKMYDTDVAKETADAAQDAFAAVAIISTTMGGVAFCHETEKFMTYEEKKFLETFKPGTQYEMSKIDDKGNVVSTHQSVDGAILQEDFAIIKFNTLTPEQQKKVVEDSHSTHGTSEDESKRLHIALDHMEGNELTIHKDEPEKARAIHEHFKHAHAQVDKVSGLEKQAAEGKGDERTMARLSLPEAKKQLGDTLQHEIIEGVLVGTSDEHQKGVGQYSQGVNTDVALLGKLPPASFSAPPPSQSSQVGHTA